MTRMRKAAAFALALALLTAGCGVQTLPPTNVTSSSATLRAEVQCSFNAAAPSGGSSRSRAGAGRPPETSRSTRAVTPRSRSRSPRTSPASSAGTTYQYRAGRRPEPKGGLVVYVRRLRGWPRPQPSGAGTFTPGLVASGADARPPSSGSAPTSSASSSTSALRSRRCARASGRSPARALARCCWPASRAACRPWPRPRTSPAGRASSGPAAASGRPLRRPAGGAPDRVRQRDLLRLSVRRRLQRLVLHLARRAVRDPLRPGARGDRDDQRSVGLLAQADDGGSGSANWVNHMFDAVPNLGTMVDGWTVHPTARATGGSPRSTA